MRTRRTPSADRHEISRSVVNRVAGSESAVDRARFLSYAAVALDGPAAPSTEQHAKEIVPHTQEEERQRRAEDRRHARELLHYSQV
jgi:hypothetical protein